MEFLNRKNFKSYDQVEIFEDSGGTDSSGLTSRTNLRVTLDDKESTYIPADSFLYIRGQIVSSAGAAITAGQIALVNSGWSLFNELTYKINNVVVEQFNEPGRVHQAHGLVNYSDDYNRGQGTNQMWSLDGGDGGIGPSQTIEVNVQRHTGATNELATFSAAAPSIFTITAGATAGQNVNLFYNSLPIRVYRYTAAGVPAGPVQLTVAATVTNVNCAGIAADDTFRFYAGTEEIVFVNPEYNIPITVTTNATPVLVFDNGTAFAAGNISCRPRNVIPSNPGFTDRRIRGVADHGFNTNRAIEMWLPIREVFKLLAEHPMPMRGATHIIELTKDTPDNYLFSDGTAAHVGAKFKYTHFSWWVPRVQYQVDVENLFISSLNDVKLLKWYGYRHEESGARTTASGIWDITTISSIPQRAYVWFIRADKYDVLTKNQMVYDNYDLESVYLRLNSESFPEYRYELDFDLDGGPIGDDSGDKYIRAYNAYLQACGNMAHSHDCLPAVGYEDFKNLFTVYCFDLYDRTESIFKSNQSVQMRLVYKLRNSVEIADAYIINAVFDVEKEISLNYSSGIITKLLSVQ